MEALGDRLKKVREDKGYSIEQVSRETNIAQRYLRALEDEDFSVFPGDTYLIGFLHNYADYLGLDSDEMVTLYKNMKLQEQPAPIEELLESSPPRISAILIIAVVLVLAVAGGLLYKFVYLTHQEGTGVKSTKVKKKQEPAAVPSHESTYEVNDSVIEKYFKQGNSILVPVGSSKILLHLQSVTDTVVLSYPSGTVNLKLGIPKTVDLDHDGKGDITITVNDIDRKVKGAVLRFDRFVNTQPKAEPAAAAPVSNNISISKEGAKVILSEDKKAPFVLTMLFRGYCLVRYIADNGERTEKYFNKGETLRLDVDNEVRLWISNAGAISARISGKDVSFGRMGEVTATLIMWKKNDQNGRFDLQLFPVN